MICVYAEADISAPGLYLFVLSKTNQICKSGSQEC